ACPPQCGSPGRAFSCPPPCHSPPGGRTAPRRGVGIAPAASVLDTSWTQNGRLGGTSRKWPISRAQIEYVPLWQRVLRQVFTLDGQPAAGLAIYQAPGANALNVAHEVRDKLAVLKREFPQGLISDIPFDTTKFVEQSIHEVYKTLYEAAV